MLPRSRRSFTEFILNSLLLVTLSSHAVQSEFASNMFLNGQYKNGISTQQQYSVNPVSNLFLEHAITSRQAPRPFMGATYLPPPAQLNCAYQEQCVLKQKCLNGFFTNNQDVVSKAACNFESHICCTLRVPPTTTTPRPTTTTTTTPKPSVYCRADQDCVAPSDCTNGEITSTNYIGSGKPRACNAPNVCCLTPSTTLTPNGYEFRKPETVFTTGEVYKPSESRLPDRAYLPPGKNIYKPTPSTTRPTPRQPPSQPSRQTPRPTQPSRQTPPPRTPPPQIYTKTPPTPVRPSVVATYLPPSIPASRPTPRTPGSSIYTPVDKYVNEATVNKDSVIKGNSLLSPQIGTKKQFGSKCPSAMLCVQEDYCNSIGVIVDSPVNLSPQAKLFRVPLIDCTIPESGAEGKCCRDSNYVDPWPVNMAGICGARNKGTSPKGIQDIDSNFGEIPWQAMVLKESSKSLLCGGAIIGADFVLTTATCVRGLDAKDCRVKAGEWELGSDGEPLKFQLVGTKYIKIHPTADMAIIRLERSLTFAQHIKPICISDKDPDPNEQCLTSGWGQQALRAHEQGAIMHLTDTSVLSRSDCGANQDSVCSATRYDACQFDPGSALACGSGSSVLLKGVFSSESGCGEGAAVRFTKPDVKWINEQFNERNKVILQSSP